MENRTLKDLLSSAISAFRAEHRCGRPRHSELADLCGMAQHRFSLVVRGHQEPRTEESARLQWLFSWLYGREDVVGAMDLLRSLKATRITWLAEQMRLAELSVSEQGARMVDETCRLLAPVLKEDGALLGSSLRNRPLPQPSGAAAGRGGGDADADE